MESRFAWRKSFRTSKSISFHNSANCGKAILIVWFPTRFATATPNVRRFGINNVTRAFLPAKWSDMNVRPTLNIICSSHIITHCRISQNSQNGGKQLEKALENIIMHNMIM